ncbi:valine--tRNA ligase, chloroplastic/mitochondrial 2-like isoform X2 [Triticum urartu]|uniref:valine--tRNA ligase, chloroplastic/mitochondrial 2-like isoform X2 n=1 Tax=Triticum urartu TaxID=4572 RepID=UPI0020442429|nr:valine--tRNA ligase, chloroplastic/mitochondrial 2-like isoform X2 [Triticum urartu]
MALAGPSHLLSSSSTCLRRLNPLLFFAHRRPAWTPRRAAHRFCAVVSERDVFTSPEVAKSFDFTSEERIYKWWESQGFFKPNFDRGGDPFVIPMPPANVTGSLHMGHAMFVTLEVG